MCIKVTHLRTIVPQDNSQRQLFSEPFLKSAIGLFYPKTQFFPALPLLLKELFGDCEEKQSCSLNFDQVKLLRRTMFGFI